MILEIQGLRAVAALLVVLFHAHFISGGFIGVDIFYVISGYLITGLLLREVEKTGRISFVKFYARRVKRLLPSSFLVLAITAIASFFILPSATRFSIGRDVVASALYISNYLFAHWQNDYQNLGATPSPVIHFWSLAVEEQFYLIWPFLLVLCIKIGGRRWLFPAIAIITFISFLFSLFLTARSPIWAFYSLPTRAWELGIGALILWRPIAIVPQKIFGWLFLTVLIFSSFADSANTAFPGWAALPPVLACAGLIRFASDLPKAISVLLRSKFAQWVGAISYPAYLWHWPVLILAPQWLGHALSIPERVAGIAVTLLLADLTHRFVEERFRHISVSSRATFISAIVATLTSVSIGVLIATSAPSSAQGFSLKDVTQKPIIYADGCQLDKNQTKSGVCEYGDPHGTKTVFLFGDSHAAQWFPTIDSISKSEHWKLIVLTKSSCPAADVVLPNVGAFRNAPCQAWRTNSIARIASSKPYAVFTSSFDHYLSPSYVSNRTKWWIAGYAKLLARLGGSSHVVVIGDTPLPSQDIPSCLTSKEASTCLAHPSNSISTLNPYLVIDPTPWFCYQNTCPAIRDGLVVYRDNTHMSVKFSLSLVPLLSQKLQQIGLITP
jgi:peptidoglycan/LPS O-acetylase OafA/YrhL